VKKDTLNNMHFGADAFTFRKAEELRINMTKAEKLLWEEIRNNKLDGLKFRRQHPIGRFIVDFYCHKLKIIIELDGAFIKKDI
jgi:very-short-patch-repair endonuclease